QPTQDFGHHLAMVAVAFDYHNPDSLYPAIYKPFDWLSTNSLLYSVAAILGKVISPSLAFRLCMASYVGGMPLVTLWSLRVFGRSAWGAVIAVPLVYNQSYVFGFANFLFAAPLAVLAIPLFYRMLTKPSLLRIGAVALCTTLLFLAHVHVFLWVGFLLCLMSLVAAIATARAARRAAAWHHGHGARLAKIIGVSLLSVLPSLALLGRWLWKTRRHPAVDEFTLMPAEKISWHSFLAALKPLSRLLREVAIYTDLVRTNNDRNFYIALIIVAGIAISIGRLHRLSHPPVMELACVLTLASYFILPEDAAGQQVIGSRQIGFGLWFAAAFFAPVPSSTTRLGRWVVVAGGVGLTVYQLWYWRAALEKFQREEAYGLEEVLAAAPPRRRMHYVNILPQSRYFTRNSFWHVEKWYMIEKFGQCSENIAFFAMNSIRYRKGYNIHRIPVHVNEWPRNNEIWDNNDLVLIHRWKPSSADLALANKRGELLAKKGDWELWKTR
ncbi:MAG: hypothetical protein FWD73_13745, partial [Polyangiaceae bacterium]|nr:hypothetical protein [Polyangiaceae bacterium]